MSRWYDGPVYAAVMDRLLDGVHGFVADHLPDGERVLDAACGTGSLARRIAATGRDVVGVDRSPRQIDVARAAVRGQAQTEGQVRFEVADLLDLDPPAEGPYDVAVTVLALHEMPSDVRPRVVARLADAARDVVLVDHAAPMPVNLPGARARAAELAAGWGHWSAFRDYLDRGGLDALAADLEVVGHRMLDGGALRWIHVRRS